MGNIVVVGSMNIDVVMGTTRLPKVGETILGESFDYMIGGKGANQAVAASRIDGQVTLLGCIGTDTFGEKLMEHLGREKLDISYIKKVENIFTGMATIFKMPTDNSIVVIQGANSFVDENYVGEYESVIAESDVILSQLEIPIESVKKSFQLGKEKNKLTILNPAPFTQQVLEILPYTDIITPNETEFEGLYGETLKSDEELEKAMVVWEDKYQTKLVVTRGSKGSSYVEDNKVVNVPTVETQVVDTTGAGDTFNGILATELSCGVPMYDAIKFATAGASLSVTRFGAQTGMPTREEVENQLKKENN